MKKIHMLGICGTGMGSLALLLKEAGYQVTGSDENVYPPMSTQLEEQGIKIFKGYKSENLQLSSPDLVIIGNVISRGNVEAEAVLSSGIKYLSMPEAVSKLFLTGKHSIVVAGTHGKTTTATLCAWLLESAGLSPGFLIGGVGMNFGVSARICRGEAPSSPKQGGRGGPPLRSYFVIEGDEYDTAFFDKGPKFLHYQPQSVILGPVEFDHADIYKNLEHVMSSFEKLVAIIPKNGLLVACADSENTLKLLPKAKCRVVTYGINKKADYHAENVSVSTKGTGFAVSCSAFQAERSSVPVTVGEGLRPLPNREGTEAIPYNFTMSLWGNHNLQNALGVVALLTELGVSPEKIGAGLKTFESVKRRQEIKGVVNGITVIDDFAHHPTAIRETVFAMRTKYKNARLISIFEPRSNTSRRNIFQHDFARAFAGSDMAIISDINRPEKLESSERLDVDALIKEINQNGTKALHLQNADEIVDLLAKEARSGDVLLVMSNGGFDNIHEKLLNKLK